jgi:ribosome-binding protein aMBF1 (putative translation factor)
MTRLVYSDAYRHFVRALIEARLAAGLTQVKLAKQLHRPQSYISKYEQNERRLDVIEFLEITRALGIAPMDIITVVLPHVGNKD